MDNSLITYPAFIIQVRRGALAYFGCRSGCRRLDGYYYNRLQSWSTRSLARCPGTQGAKQILGRKGASQHARPGGGTPSRMDRLAPETMYNTLGNVMASREMEGEKWTRTALMEARGCRASSRLAAAQVVSMGLDKVVLGLGNIYIDVEVKC